ncbi:hypothetical protein B0H11DRAFT_1901825 [Mycena galericulata]|nr:hypothetical protein B0H11DRAFT_1901825 [Mycena galericulata]
MKRPECPAYWSLDPFGCERLSPNEASELGFPSFEWKRSIYFRSWDERVYAGLSQFHAAKGLDPYSQDIARHLGCSLYKLSSCDQGANNTRIEEALPKPDVGNPDLTSESSQTQNEDGMISLNHFDAQYSTDTLMAAQYNETHRDHQNKFVVDISTTQMDRQLTIRHVRLMVGGSLAVFFTLP